MLLDHELTATPCTALLTTRQHPLLLSWPQADGYTMYCSLDHTATPSSALLTTIWRHTLFCSLDHKLTATACTALLTTSWRLQPVLLSWPQADGYTLYCSLDNKLTATPCTALLTTIKLTATPCTYTALLKNIEKHLLPQFVNTIQ